jgi:hypothetical protein
VAINLFLKKMAKPGEYELQRVKESGSSKLKAKYMCRYLFLWNED